MSHLLTRELAELTPQGDELYMLDLASSEGLPSAPFHASWWTVTPGSATQVDQHAEHEIWIIDDGAGSFTCAGETTHVRAGDVMRIEPHAPHQIENTGSERLTVYSLWWDQPRA